MKTIFTAATLCLTASGAYANNGNEVEPAPEASLSTLLADGDVTLKVFGRLLQDWTWATGGDDGLYDTDDGVEFRAARIGVSGTVFDVVDYKAEYDFVGGDADFKDVLFSFATGIGKVSVGNFKEPMSLEELTSSRFISFNERSLMNALVPGRNTGIALSDSCDNFNWTFGIFRDSDDFGDDNNTNGPGDTEQDGEYAFTGRVTTAPIHEDDGERVLHLGLSYSLRGADDDMARFRSRPEAHLMNRPVDTGVLAADGVNLGGLEVAYVQGPFSAQAEYFMAAVDAQSGGMDADYAGFYTEVTYFLTGERRNYKKSAGKFDRVKPNTNVQRGSFSGGAWQTGLRYSMLDLDDGPSADEISNITASLKWILNPNTRIALNLIQSDAESGAIEDDATIAILRFQADY